MKTRLIALDLDGTLLDDQKRLPERNRKALEECISRGIYIVPCTGRIALGIPDAIRLMPGVRYGITVNGGALVDMQENKILDEKLIPTRTALEIYDLLSRYHVMCDAYIKGQGYSDRYCFEHMDEYGISDVIQDMVRKTRIPVDSVKDYIIQGNHMVDKLNMFFDSIEERAQVRRILEERGDVLISSSLNRNLEINGPGATKGEGLLRLAQILGIPQEETMAFGDEENDFSMIEKAGIGIAMANGNDRLKEMADYIAPGNGEAGVGQMIEKLVLSCPQ